jgi:hypothetical protein
VNFTVQIDLVRDATRNPNEPAVIGKVIKQPVSYWRGDNYGVGAHEIPGTNTTIGIRYHIELAGLPRPPGSEPEAQPQR